MVWGDLRLCMWLSARDVIGRNPILECSATNLTTIYITDSISLLFAHDHTIAVSYSYTSV